jgi:predicted Ser/Thr protein kinase
VDEHVERKKTSMKTIRLCTQCLQPLPENAPEGLCPRCLAKVALETEPGRPSQPKFPDPAELAPQFPQLEINELLGAGGMGMVYKARQPRLDRVVALKLLPLREGGARGFAERFAREARALAKLSHPGIVAVYDFGETSDYCYFVMEYVDGMNLRQLLHAQPISPRQALDIVVQICTALQFAHDEKIVHRDIKPENILINKKGQVKIADFGLAKLLGTAADTNLTQSQAVMGTLNYMAPEQRENSKDIDHRADIYSLGVVFYEMLTGQVPMGRFEPPSKRVQIDVRLDEVVLRALEREPERRYQQASQVKTDLENVTEPSGLKPPKIQPVVAPGAVEQERRRQEIRLPALGLLATGILNWLLLPLTMAYLLPALARAAAYFGIPRTELTLIGFVALAVTPLVLYTLLIYAGLKMMRCQAYRVALGASIVAMLAAPGNLIGFPIGIWALLTLRRREIRAAFEEAQQKPQTRESLAAYLVKVGAPTLVLLGLLSMGAMVCLRNDSIASAVIVLLTELGIILSVGQSVYWRLKIRRAREEGLWPQQGEIPSLEHVKRLAQAGEKFLAIRLYRRICPVSAKDAKELVDGLVN